MKNKSSLEKISLLGATMILGDAVLNDYYGVSIYNLIGLNPKQVIQEGIKIIEYTTSGVISFYLGKREIKKYE
ncbi:MAG: hypothetical protein ACOC1K_04385 [Nanoarchaeota archaeon]